MRIDQIKLINFRQHRNTVLDFPKSKETDLHVFIANNGSGKTNIMNAISWCLYERDLVGNPKEDKLPDFNLHAEKEAIEAGEDHLDISVTLKIENGADIYTIERSQFIKLPEEFCHRTQVKIYHQNEKGTEIIEDENRPDEVDRIIQDLLPVGISQYSFFDGETLQNYFNNNGSKSVKDAIHKMAQIDVLQNAEDHLASIIREKTNILSKLDPNIEQYQAELEKDTSQEEQFANTIEELDKEIKKAEDWKDELTQLIGGNEHIKELDESYQEAGKQLEKLEEEKSKFNDAINDFFRKSYIELALKDVLQGTNTYIQEKSAKLPAREFSKELLEECLKDEECHLCHTHLTPQTEQIIRDLLSRYELAPAGSQTLLSIRDSVRRLCQEIQQYPANEEKFNQEEMALHQRVEEQGKRKAEYESRLNQVSNVNDVEDWIDERSGCEKMIKINSQKKGKYQLQQEELKKKILQDKKKLEQAEDDSHEQGEVSKEIRFARKADNILSDIKKEIVGEIRQKTTKETKSYFNELAYKKQTFGDIEIDENYQLTVYHKNADLLGKRRSMLGSLSAAERELLALAFTLAILKVSGYDSMLVIDTPVGRVDDNNRRNFAHCLVDVSRQKQLILFFTSTEYDEEIQQEFDPACSTKHRIRMSENEDESVLEEVK